MSQQRRDNDTFSKACCILAYFCLLVADYLLVRWTVELHGGRVPFDLLCGAILADTGKLLLSAAFSFMSAESLAAFEKVEFNSVKMFALPASFYTIGYVIHNMISRTGIVGDVLTF